MSDPSRTESSRGRDDAASGADRDAKIEQLLLLGLDHYFAARYDQAINVWTRVLFLDRNHPRARAYVERARSALAERQRQSEELLQHGVAAFKRGEGGEARKLLQAAIDGGAPPDEALAVLDRLNRLETGPSESPRARLGREHRAVVPRAGRALSLTAFVAWAVPVCVVAAIGVYVAGAWSRWAQGSGLPDRPATTAASTLVSDPGLPLPTRGEVALTRARTLVTAGHLREALAILDRVRSTDPQKAEADELRGEIQRQLLAPPSDAAAPASPARGKEERRAP
jgi:tetratricopeptide (TPR) repeat protein